MTQLALATSTEIAKAKPLLSSRDLIMLQKVCGTLYTKKDKHFKGLCGLWVSK